MNEPRDDGVFSQTVLDRLFPADRADRFFEALFADVDEGAYDIRLVFKGRREDRLTLAFQLTRRPGKCLACHLTYGLPQVFARHPVINLKALVDNIEGLLNGSAVCSRWALGQTREVTSELHEIPFTIDLTEASNTR